MKDSKRVERVPLHKQKLITNEERPGYVRRWVNDIPGRVDRFIKAGWKIVEGNIESTSDQVARIEGQLGSQIRRTINKNSPNATAKEAILMEIPQEFYDEDQAAKAEQIELKETAFTQHGSHTKKGFYGEVSIEKN